MVEHKFNKIYVEGELSKHSCGFAVQLTTKTTAFTEVWVPDPQHAHESQLVPRLYTRSSPYSYRLSDARQIYSPHTGPTRSRMKVANVGVILHTANKRVCAQA